MGYHADLSQMFGYGLMSVEYRDLCRRLRERSMEARSDGIVDAGVYAPGIKPKGAKDYISLRWRVAYFFESDEDQQRMEARFTGLYTTSATNGIYLYFEKFEDAVMIRLSW